MTKIITNFQIRIFPKICRNIRKYAKSNLVFYLSFHRTNVISYLEFITTSKNMHMRAHVPNSTNNN